MLMVISFLILCSIAYGAKVRKINAPPIEVDVQRAIQLANGDLNTAQVNRILNNIYFII